MKTWNVSLLALILAACGSGAPNSPNPLPSPTPNPQPTPTPTPTPGSGPTVTITDAEPRNGALFAVEEATFSAKAVSPYTTLTYHWDWGDGSDPTDTSNEGLGHIFVKNGTFTVKVTVNDGHGKTASDSVEYSTSTMAGRYDGHYGPEPVSATISQNNANLSGSVSWGSVPNGRTLTGHVNGDLRVSLNLDGPDLDGARCAQGSSGTVDPNHDRIITNLKDCGQDPDHFTLDLQKR